MSFGLLAVVERDQQILLYIKLAWLEVSAKDHSFANIVFLLGLLLSQGQIVYPELSSHASFCNKAVSYFYHHHG